MDTTTNHLSKTEPDLERLRICIVTSTYPRHEADYAVPWLRESIAQFADRGHKITVLAPSFEGLQDHRIDGVEVVRFRYSPKRFERLTHEQGAPNRIRNPWYQLLGAPYLLMGCRAARRLAKRQSFDIVHAHWPFPHEPIGAAAAKVAQAPLAITAHGAEFALARLKPWVAACLKRSLQKADLRIANSSDTASQMLKLSGCQAEVLPFGSTVKPKSICVTKNPIPRILFTGRLIQRKGVEYLLRAVPLVLQSRRAQFVITGDGDQRAALESLCHTLQIGDAVEFLGFVDNRRLGEEYAHCDLWVNPSIVDDRGDTEGLGVGAIEAYAYGKPVIASAVGGIPDAVLHEETGILVPEKDPTALAAAICELLDNPAKARRLAATGVELSQQRFSWSRITDRLETLYIQTILDHARPTGATQDRERSFDPRTTTVRSARWGWPARQGSNPC
jgi:glycosyltransferase involved in cell wall biosynthesis